MKGKEVMSKLPKVKSNKDIYNHNLELIKKTNSKLAYQIQITDPSPLEFCTSKNEQLNLKRTYQGQTYYYHSQNDPLAEAKEWFEKLELQNSTVLYVYGIGLGYYYEAAKAWLKQKKTHALVFLEEDIGVLRRLLETELGRTILKDSQVKIIYFTDVLEDKEIFNEIAWTYIQCPFTISSLKLYADVNPQGCTDLSHRLSHESVQKITLVDEYLQYGIAFFRNFYPNLFELPHSFLGNALFEKFKNTPAIICGAGPSLNKNIDFLKTLSKKALIFAGSSALPALIAKDLNPHFGAAIDPNKAQVVRVKSVQDKGRPIPFFYRNRLFHEALLAIKGPRIYLTGTGGYNVAEWFEMELGIEGGEPLDEGHNVINFCMEIAQALGCNPIILVGVDLALTNDEQYAEGVVASLKLTEEDLKMGPDLDSKPLLKKDIYDKPVYTYWKWVTESEWISNYAKEHSDITIINATEGGLGFKDIPNKKLKEVAQEYLKREDNFYKKIDDSIKNHSLSRITREQIEQLMMTLQNSLKNCIGYFETLVKEMDKIDKELKSGENVSNSLESPVTILTEGEIEKEIGYQYLLDIFNVIFLRLNHRELQSIQGVSKVENKKRIKLHKKRLNFLKDVAQVNIELMERTMKNAPEEKGEF